MLPRNMRLYHLASILFVVSSFPQIINASKHETANDRPECRGVSLKECCSEISKILSLSGTIMKYSRMSMATSYYALYAASALYAHTMVASYAATQIALAQALLSHKIDGNCKPSASINASIEYHKAVLLQAIEKATGVMGVFLYISSSAKSLADRIYQNHVMETNRPTFSPGCCSHPNEAKELQVAIDNANSLKKDMYNVFTDVNKVVNAAVDLLTTATATVKEQFYDTVDSKQFCCRNDFVHQYTTNTSQLSVNIADKAKELVDKIYSAMTALQMVSRVGTNLNMFSLKSSITKFSNGSCKNITTRNSEYDTVPNTVKLYGEEVEFSRNLSQLIYNTIISNSKKEVNDALYGAITVRFSVFASADLVISSVESKNTSCDKIESKVPDRSKDVTKVADFINPIRSSATYLKDTSAFSRILGAAKYESFEPSDAFIAMSDEFDFDYIFKIDNTVNADLYKNMTKSITTRLSFSCCEIENETF